MEDEAANGLSVGGDVGYGFGQSEREAEGQDQEPCAGRLNAAERDTVVVSPVGACAESIWGAKSGLI